MNIHGSFRDPSGFLFWRDGAIYRQINTNYRETFDHLMNSGLYNSLVEAGLLVSHTETDIPPVNEATAYKVIEPEKIHFISYPYEWCFSELKDAALTTMRIEKIALKHGMSLKDASAYNIQFMNGRPILIDTLSLETYREGRPWIAYGQFCQHFLAPLALMSLSSVKLGQLSRIYIDGIPLDLASVLLPFRSKFIPSLFSHIHLHAKNQKLFSGTHFGPDKFKINLKSLTTLVEYLENIVDALSCKRDSKEWSDYYTGCSYSLSALDHKKQLISQYLDMIRPKSLWDLGANTGVFSRLASLRNIQTIAFDFDHESVEKNYLLCKKNNEINILPLLIDLTNPSPAIGWENSERMSLQERGPTDTVLALALIHHVAISNNVPMGKIAGFFKNICRTLIIEFIPNDDPQVKKLMLQRRFLCHEYSRQAFEREFYNYFSIQRSDAIGHSGRILYLMSKKEN